MSSVSWILSIATQLGASLEVQRASRNLLFGEVGPLLGRHGDDCVAVGEFSSEDSATISTFDSGLRFLRVLEAIFNGYFEVVKSDYIPLLTEQ